MLDKTERANKELDIYNALKESDLEALKEHWEYINKRIKNHFLFHQRIIKVALKHSNLDIIKFIIKNDKNCSHLIYTFFSILCENNRAEIIKYLLKKNFAFGDTFNDSTTKVFFYNFGIAVDNNSLDTIKILIEYVSKKVPMKDVNYYLSVSVVGKIKEYNSFKKNFKRIFSNPEEGQRDSLEVIKLLLVKDFDCNGVPMSLNNMRTLKKIKWAIDLNIDPIDITANERRLRKVQIGI